MAKFKFGACVVLMLLFATGCVVAAGSSLGTAKVSKGSFNRPPY